MATPQEISIYLANKLNCPEIAEEGWAQRVGHRNVQQVYTTVDEETQRLCGMMLESRVKIRKTRRAGNTLLAEELKATHAAEKLEHEHLQAVLEWLSKQSHGLATDLPVLPRYRSAEYFKPGDRVMAYVGAEKAWFEAIVFDAGGRVRAFTLTPCFHQKSTIRGKHEVEYDKYVGPVYSTDDFERLQGLLRDSTAHEKFLRLLPAEHREILGSRVIEDPRWSIEVIMRDFLKKVHETSITAAGIKQAADRLGTML